MVNMESLGVIAEENIEGYEQPDVDADSGVDETTQAKENGEVKKPSRIPKKTPPQSPQKRARQLNPLDSRRMPRSKSVPKPAFTTFSSPPSSSESKKVPMNKVVVGYTPSPNLKKIHSKVGSLSNTTHRPGGGQVKIESRKLDWQTTSRTKTLNDGYTPGGGDKKIDQKKLSWNAESKVGSLSNTSHKPGGGRKQIESRKVEWNAGSKVGSKNNINHKPGGGNVQIHNEKVKVEVGSRIGSLSNVKHRAGGGDKKIFDDREYMRQSSEATSARSGPASMNGSIVGSTSQLVDDGRRNKNESFRYANQISRKLSPMSSGF